MMLKIKDLSFSYKTKKGKNLVFDDLNIDFMPGFNVILGPNGSGKSTMLKSIFGLLSYKGEIWFGGNEITKISSDEKAKLISYLPQMDIETSSLTVMEMVLLGRLPELTRRIKKKDLNIVNKTMNSLNISHLATRPFNELSGGQKKIVFIAQTLVREPKIILLDEPVNSLDLQKQLELCSLLREIIKEKNINIIVVLHDINLACRFAHHIVILDSEGKLYSYGKPKEVVNKKMLEEVYGVVASVSYDENEIPSIAAIRSVNRTSGMGSSLSD